MQGSKHNPQCTGGVQTLLDGQKSTLASHSNYGQEVYPSDYQVCEFTCSLISQKELQILRLLTMKTQGKLLNKKAGGFLSNGGKIGHHSSLLMCFCELRILAKSLTQSICSAHCCSLFAVSVACDQCWL